VTPLRMLHQVLSFVVDVSAEIFPLFAGSLPGPAPWRSEVQEARVLGLAAEMGLALPDVLV
jgi:hypothetical protein